MEWTLRVAKRLIVGVIGATVILLGVAMLFLPGPALVVIPAGLAILATEFAWARHLLKRVRDEVANRTGYGNSNSAADPAESGGSTPAGNRQQNRPGAAPEPGVDSSP
jgi:hypothetical protein